MAHPSTTGPKAVSSKDGWDKTGIVAQALIPAALALFTIVYGHLEKQQKQQEAQAAARLEEEKARTLKANTVVTLLPVMPVQADSLKIPVIAAVLESLGYGDVALRLVTAQSKPTRSNVAVLRDLASSDSAQTAAAAKQALTEIAQTGGGGDTTVALQAVSALRLAASTQPNAGPEWGIVTGNYASLNQAQMAADSSSRSGFPARVYRRNDAWRTAIQFPNRSVARAALPLIRARVRRGAYGVIWGDWCPGGKNEQSHYACDRSAPERQMD